MTEEVCARPGCRHDHMNALVGSNVSLTVGPLVACCECPCPSYRTQAQQEAWERAAVLRLLEPYP